MAVIIVRDGQVVQSVQFKHTNVIHYNPVHAIHAFNAWAIDEMVVLNVSKSRESQDGFLEVVQNISHECFVPLSVGGWVDNIDYAAKLFKNGADKVVINTHAYENPSFITELAHRYGNQAVVVSIDANQNENKQDVVTINRGKVKTETLVTEWAQQAQIKGAGEIFLNSIPHDGNRKGYHLELMKAVKDRIQIPLVAMGGVFTWDHLAEGAAIADAVAAANIFHYTEHSTKKAKQFLLDKNLNFRKI